MKIMNVVDRQRPLKQCGPACRLAARVLFKAPISVVN
uniref:Uncharacterized protein n=1 Tax=Anguilla anguilla TaxID=7936 RepID=A0A0E9VVG2_ANGAN